MHESAIALVCDITPWLSNSGKLILEKLGSRADTLCTAPDIVNELGLSNRFELVRSLQREGLPQFDELRGWLQVISWVYAFEISRHSLSAIARRAGKQPSALYRRVKQVTGLTWKQLTTSGLAWTMNAFLERCRVPKSYLARERPRVSAPATDAAIATFGVAETVLSPSGKNSKLSDQRRVYALAI